MYIVLCAADRQSLFSLLVNLAILRFLTGLSRGGLAAAVSSLDRFLATQ